MKSDASGSEVPSADLNRRTSIRDLSATGAICPRSHKSVALRSGVIIRPGNPMDQQESIASTLSHWCRILASPDELIVTAVLRV